MKPNLAAAVVVHRFSTLYFVETGERTSFFECFGCAQRYLKKAARGKRPLCYVIGPIELEKIPNGATVSACSCAAMGKEADL